MANYLDAKGTEILVDAIRDRVTKQSLNDNIKGMTLPIFSSGNRVTFLDENGDAIDGFYFITESTEGYYGFYNPSGTWD